LLVPWDAGVGEDSGDGGDDGATATDMTIAKFANCFLDERYVHVMNFETATNVLKEGDGEMASQMFAELFKT